MTSGYRQRVLGQKVTKFEPLCVDGSAARWNPLAEINFRTLEEMSDIAIVVTTMTKPNGEKKVAIRFGRIRQRHWSRG